MDNNCWVIVNAIVFFSLSLYPCLKIRRGNGKWAIVKIPQTSVLLYMCIILLYCVIDRTDGDYFHLKEELQRLATHPDDYSGIEPFYRFVGIRTSFSYSLFRLIIWGAAFVLYGYCLKQINILSLGSLWLFVLIALPYFSYPRVSLAICVYLSGFFSFFYRGNRMIGILLFLIAYWLHKSIFILLLLTPLCAIRMTKMRALLFLCLSVILSYMLPEIVVFFVEKIGGRESMFIMRYIAGTQTMGIAEVFQSLLFWFPSAILLYVILSDKSFFIENKFLNQLSSLVIIILSLSLVVQFSGLGSKFIYTRIREFCILPMCILFSCYLQNRSINFYIQVCTMLYFCSDFYYMCYRYYLKAIGTGI